MVRYTELPKELQKKLQDIAKDCLFVIAFGDVWLSNYELLDVPKIIEVLHDYDSQNCPLFSEDEGRYILQDTIVFVQEKINCIADNSYLRGKVYFFISEAMKELSLDKSFHVDMRERIKDSPYIANNYPIHWL